MGMEIGKGNKKKKGRMKLREGDYMIER